MRGGNQWLVGLLLVAIFNVTFAVRCDREPEGHTSPKTPLTGNRFRLKIIGNPSKYVPGVVYTVSLHGARTLQVAQKFTGFMIVVEPSGPLLSSTPYPMMRDSDPSLPDYHRPQVGRFSLFGDTLIRFSERCPNSVMQTSSLSKSEVQVMWTAPPAGSGCVVFRATVVEYRDQWFMDDGPLSKILCEDVQESLDEQPKINDPCCACDEAKYEVTFEGLWSRHTHPKDYPNNGWLTRFSDVIGASHTADYRFWDYGTFASEGLRQVAEGGSTRMLESELKADSQSIRTIIKARGISYPNVTGKTFAVFRVDRRHHLMSLVSMIDPSPDWIVGVSGLELCLRNCSWVEHKVLNLYPWDAGTDSGLSYTSPDMPTNPRKSIRRITSSYPNDSNSPFYDPTGTDMKPLARLYLTRQRLYEKSCADDAANEDNSTWDDSSQQAECEVNEWSDWSPCSATCGKGIKHRQRFYVNPIKAEIQMCNRLLTSRNQCEAPRPCGSIDVDDVITNSRCQMTEWSQWSGCSVSCGQGQHTRTRGYKLKTSRKYCSTLVNAPRLQQTDICYGTEGAHCVDDMEEDSSDPLSCQMKEWSEWSPCSATCGRGKRLRTRVLAVNDPQALGILSMNADSYDGQTMGSKEDCSDVRTIEEVECEADISSCELQPDKAKDVCQLPKEVGPCRGFQLRWFFDTHSESCQEFSFGKCRGNRNNFSTKEECEKACKDYKEDPFHGFKPSSQIRDPDLNRTYGLSSVPSVSHDTTDNPDNDITTAFGPMVDCEVTRWGPWSPCSVTCGRGFKERVRRIKVHARNGGRPCVQKLSRTKKCKLAQCEMMEPTDDNPTWGPAQPGRGSVNCELAPWSLWSPCSMTCGLNAVQQRTRSILVPPSVGGMPCGHRLETRTCALLPCTY